jgi:predicted transposase/invertase (TIGR01784 family)
VVLFPYRNIEPHQVHLHRSLLNGNQVHRVFLDDLRGLATESIGIGLIQLVLADSAEAVIKAKSLLTWTQVQERTDAKIAAIIELIETIVVYKFPQLSRQEIERMLGVSELRQTKVYQEALQEGRQEGRQEGERSLILRLLSCQVGKLSPELEAKVQVLSDSQLNHLGEALLEFRQLADFVGWLQIQDNGSPRDSTSFPPD